MQRWLVAASMTFLLIASFGVPDAAARCPDPPRDCSSFIDLININISGSRQSVGVYEADPEEQTSFTATASDETQENQVKDGRLSNGETGGVLVIVDEVGSATSFTYTFPASPGGIVWQNGNTLTIMNPVAGDHYVLPFEVTKVTSNLELTFTAEDDQGNQAQGAVTPFPSPPDLPTSNVSPGAEAPGLPQWAYTVIAFVGLLVIIGLIGRMRRK